MPTDRRPLHPMPTSSRWQPLCATSLPSNIQRIYFDFSISLVNLLGTLMSQQASHIDGQESDTIFVFNILGVNHIRSGKPFVEFFDEFIQ